MKRNILAALIAFSGLAGSLWLIGWSGDGPLGGSGTVVPYTRASFDHWIGSDPEAQAEFEKLVHFLASKDVGNVVPIWQLTRTDSNRAKTCERPEFLVPPRETWDKIVPVLALLRDEIEPELGELEVVSSYRNLDFNGCIGGASKSQHLNFAAVDLVANEKLPNTELFGKLCAIQKRLGPPSQFGLGAYFDPKKPAKANGRFHVDVSGYRSWGYSKSTDSSGCRAFD